MLGDDDDDAFERQLAARLAGRRDERLSRFAPEVLAWMAFPPLWTEALAQRCGFPGVAPSLWSELAGAGLCEQGTLVAGEREEKTAWMPEPARAEVIASLRSHHGQLFVDDCARQIGTAVRRGSGPRWLALVAPLARWAELASAGHRAPRELRVRVRALVAAGDTGEALGWIEAARQLAGKVSAPLGPAIALCERQLEIAYRDVQDRRHLASFLERAEQIRAVEALLDGGDGGDGGAKPWALHLLGMGGVGKTMLVRHATARLCAARGMPVARIDFDYLSPEYPAHRPEQLLSALADELAPYCATDRQQASLESFERLTGGLIEARSDGAPPGEPLALLGQPGFVAALRAFADVLGLLPRPPLLVLDTCEELAKVEAADATVPSLDATFEILERLREKVPGLRVLFAGRRLLAWSGPGWRAADAAREGHRRLAAEKGYLRLCVLRGFDRTEVDAYLARVLGARADEAATAAILAQSGDAGELRGAGIERVDETEPGTRYNPFDVALFAGWLRDDPALDLGRLARGAADPYVELRILARIESPAVRRALPGLVLLRRFDRASARMLFAGSDVEIAAAYRTLGEQEWVEHVTGASGGALAIHAKLLPRLKAYFEHPDRGAELLAMKAALASGLADQLRSGALDVDAVDAALRVMPADEAAALWERLDRELVAQRRWGVAVALAARVLAEDGAAGAPDGPLRAAVRATHTEAIEQTQPGGDTGAAWAEVERAAGLHPDASLAAWLAQRAVAGVGAAARAGRRSPAPERLAALWRLIDAYVDARAGEGSLRGGRGARGSDDARAARLAPAICAALDVALDAAPAAALPPLASVERLFAVIDRLDGADDLAAFARMLAARTAARARRWREARRQFAAALAALPAADDARGAWTPWISAAALRDRVRLEALVSGAWLLGEASARAIDGWADEAIGRLDGIDAERLVSQIVRLGLERGLVAEEDLDRFEAHDRYDPDRSPSCAAHREVPPLFASIVEARAAIGDRRRALLLVDQRIREATREGRDKLTVTVAQRAKLAVWRRFRQPPEGLLGQLAMSSEPEDLVAAFPVMALCQGVAPPLPRAEARGSAAVLHAWWRSQPGRVDGVATRILMEGVREARSGVAAREGDPDGLDGALEVLDLELDGRDVVRIAPRIATATVSIDEIPRLLDPAWATHHRRVRRVLRIALRAGEASPSAHDAGSSLWSRWLRRLPPRLVAEMALDEAEVLSLRSPAEARRLFDVARQAYARSGDPFGAALAAIHALVTAADERLPPHDVAAIARDLVAPAYGALRRTSARRDHVGLPAWSSLVDWSEGEPFPAFDASPYKHLLYRLLGALLWADEGGEGARSERLARVLSSRGDKPAPPPPGGKHTPAPPGGRPPAPKKPAASSSREEKTPAASSSREEKTPAASSSREERRAPAAGAPAPAPHDDDRADEQGSIDSPLHALQQQDSRSSRMTGSPAERPTDAFHESWVVHEKRAREVGEPEAEYAQELDLRGATVDAPESAYGKRLSATFADAGPLMAPAPAIEKATFASPPAQMPLGARPKRGAALLAAAVLVALGTLALVMGASAVFIALRNRLMGAYLLRVMLSVGTALVVLVLIVRHRADLVELIERCVLAVQRLLQSVAALVASRVSPGPRAARLVLEDSLVGVRVSIRRKARPGSRSPEPSPDEEEAFELPLPDGEATHADAAGALPAAACAALEALLVASRASPSAVDTASLEVPRWLAAPPWEALFALAAAGRSPTSGPHDPGDAEALLRARAPLYRLQRVKHAERPPWSGRVTALGLSETRLAFWPISTPEEVDDPETPPAGFATDVLHLLGAPARRAAGILLRVRTPGGDRLIQPEPWFRGAGLVVLQLDPIDGYLRTATDRLEMAALRELAAEAIAAGAAHVVVLPALPPLLAWNVTRRLELRARGASPLSAAELIGALQRIRRSICPSREVESRLPERLELALDVSLYTTTEVDPASAALAAARDDGP